MLTTIRIAICALSLGAFAFIALVPIAGHTADTPKGREDWPAERVVVIGKRGSFRDWLVNHTLIGTEGFADGSAPTGVGTRSDYPFQVYYAPNGKIEARFRRLGARVPHGPIEELDYVEFGTWRLDEDDDFCQTIPKVGWGTEVCFWIDRRGNRVAFYYTKCGALNRCYAGRLGPEGELRKGRVFTR